MLAQLCLGVLEAVAIVSLREGDLPGPQAYRRYQSRTLDASEDEFAKSTTLPRATHICSRSTS